MAFNEITPDGGSIAGNNRQGSEVAEALLHTSVPQFYSDSDDIATLSTVQHHGIESNQAVCLLEAPSTDSASVGTQLSSSTPNEDATRRQCDPSNPFIGNILRIDELRQHVGEEDWLVEGLLRRGEFAMLFGPSGSAKTFLCTDLSVSIAAGLPWCIDRFRVPKPRRVMYCYAEGYYAFPKRWEAILARVSDEVRETILENIRLVPYVPSLFDSTSPYDVRNFIAACKWHSKAAWDLIVIDTLFWGTIGGNENLSHDAGIILMNARIIQQEFGASILFVHHANKAGDDRGSTAFRGAMDLQMRTGSHDGQFCLSIIKLKDGQPISDIAYGLQSSGESAVICWEDCGHAPSVESATDKTYSTLQSDPNRWWTVKEVVGKTGLSEQGTKKILDKLQDRVEKRLYDPVQVASSKNPTVYRIRHDS